MGFFKISEEEFLLKRSDLEKTYCRELENFKKGFGDNNSVDITGELEPLFSLVRRHERKLWRLTFRFKYFFPIRDLLMILILVLFVYYIKISF